MSAIQNYVHPTRERKESNVKTSRFTMYLGSIWIIILCLRPRRTMSWKRSQTRPKSNFSEHPLRDCGY